MTLVQLRHLIAVADSGSFSRSAETLFLTQPALSRSIRALEDELGQPLFDRVGRRNELTPFGREVLQRARQLVSDADELANSSRQMRDGQAGRLRVGLGSGPGALLMTPLLQHMASRHPKVQVEIARGQTALLVEQLRERRLDALVVDARSVEPALDLQVEAVAELRGAFLCRAGHPLTRQRRALGFADLQAWPIASTPLSDEVARILIERYGPAAHPARCVTLRCEEIASLVDVVEHSDAVLLAVRSAAPGLVELNVAPPLDTRARFGLVTLAGRAEPPALDILRDVMSRLLHD
jgi:DNA-binding transcriptional LysR family regulator